jgi:hypothetical protein
MSITQPLWCVCVCSGCLPSESPSSGSFSFLTSDASRQRSSKQLAPNTSLAQSGLLAAVARQACQPSFGVIIAITRCILRYTGRLLVFQMVYRMIDCPANRLQSHVHVTAGPQVLPDKSLHRIHSAHVVGRLRFDRAELPGSRRSVGRSGERSLTRSGASRSRQTRTQALALTPVKDPPSRLHPVAARSRRRAL